MDIVWWLNRRIGFLHGVYDDERVKGMHIDVRIEELKYVLEKIEGDRSREEIVARSGHGKTNPPS